MAILLSQSEQIGVLFEAISVRDAWVFSRVAFQHYVAADNDFQSWVEGWPEIYEADLKCLIRDLATFDKRGPTGQEFRFEPEVEPSFELRVQPRASGRNSEVVVSFALDIKRVLGLTIPTAYRENRITLQLLTDWERFHRFAEQFSMEAAKLGPPQSRVLR
jgi:hypothetical protein